MPSNKEIFTAYYLENLWGDPMSVSGPSSTVEHTRETRNIISVLICSLKIKKILDAPCGDYNWFRFVHKNSSVSYLGADIVEPLIEKNNIWYGDYNTKFIKLDILEDVLPKADLLICRECLQHLPMKDCFKFFENFKKSEIKYLLITSWDSEKNEDTVVGGFRRLDLLKKPFDFEAPLGSFKEWSWPGQSEKRLILWERKKMFKKI